MKPLAIQVKKLKSGVYQGERIKAIYRKKTLTLKIDRTKTIEQNVNLLVKTFCKKHRLRGTWIGAMMPNDYYAFIRAVWDSDLVILIK